MTEQLPQPGHRIGRYRVETLLGEGGMGAVFAATNDVTGRAVAIKWMLPAMARSDEAVKRFLAEARATARIEHPNVIQILDVGQDGSAPFLVMERLRGESLGERLTKVGRLSIHQTLAVMIPACKGVGEAHKEGIIHRDIKPDNIFLCQGKDGSPRAPKVLDFGISKLYEDGEQKLTQTGAIMGTPLYMSPEQINARREPDAGFDIYSLGVVLYECLAGRMPFDAPGLIGLLQRIGSGESTPLHAAAPDVPVEVCNVVHRAMAANREERFATMPELIAALETLQSTVPDNVPDNAPDRGTVPVGTGPLPGPTRPAGASVPGTHVSGIAPTAAMSAVPGTHAPVPATQMAAGAPPTHVPMAPAAPADNAGKVLLMMAVGLVTVIILSGMGLAYYVTRTGLPDVPPGPTAQPAQPGLLPANTPTTPVGPNAPSVNVTFSGACGSGSLTGNLMVQGVRDTITIIQMSGATMVGNLTVGVPVGVRAGGAFEVSTMGRINDHAAILHFMSGDTMWMNMAADTSAVMSGAPDAISGRVIVRSFAGSAATADLTFENVVLQNMENGSLCTLNGTMQTRGNVTPSF